MTSWLRVDAGAPCAICGKSDWCSVSEDGAFAICRRVGDARARVKIDRAGAEYWVYKIGGAATPPLRVVPPRPSGPDVASAAERDAVYRMILKNLRLSTADRASLAKRGLSDQAITSNLYRSLPRAGRAPVVRRVIDHFGEGTALRVPGIVRRDGVHGSFLTLAGAEGVIVPVRNVAGEIIALKVRRPDAQPKYTYLSSKDAGGPGPGSPVHVPRHAAAAGEVVRLTEGELKADVATELSGLLTISVAGVGTWRQALPALRALGARTCRLAFDADARTNVHVAAALKNVALQLVLEGFGLEVETWAPRFKGIDECLRAGAPTEVLAGTEAFAETDRLVGLARAGA